MDIWSEKKRSELMSKIRGKNTKPEMILRSALFKQGFRFRVHRKDLLGMYTLLATEYSIINIINICFIIFI